MRASTYARIGFSIPCASRSRNPPRGEPFCQPLIGAALLIAGNQWRHGTNLPPAGSLPRSYRLGGTPSRAVRREFVRPNTSVFGRLVLLGKLLDHNRGCYVVALSASMCQCVIIGKVFGKAHSEIFLDWLSMSLERKACDLSLYLNGIDRKPLTYRAIASGAARDIAPLYTSALQRSDLIPMLNCAR